MCPQRITGFFPLLFQLCGKLWQPKARVVEFVREMVSLGHGDACRLHVKAEKSAWPKPRTSASSLYQPVNDIINHPTARSSGLAVGPERSIRITQGWSCAVQTVAQIQHPCLGHRSLVIDSISKPALVQLSFQQHGDLISEIMGGPSPRIFMSADRGTRSASGKPGCR